MFQVSFDACRVVFAEELFTGMLLGVDVNEADSIVQGGDASGGKPVLETEWTGAEVGLY